MGGGLGVRTEFRLQRGWWGKRRGGLSGKECVNAG